VLYLQVVVVEVQVGVTEVQDLLKAELLVKQDLSLAMVAVTLVPKEQLVEPPPIMPQRYSQVQAHIRFKTPEILN
jgi:hypothetical protein